MKKVLCFTLTAMLIVGMLLVSTASAQEETVKLRIMWWGSQARHDATIAVINMYMEQNPNVEIEYEFMGYDDYWQKLNTLFAANDAPDIFQIGNNFLTYEDQIEPLDDYVASGVIDTTNIASTFLAPTTIKGNLLGISLGINALSMIYDPAILEEAGVTEPTEDWTWDDFEQACYQVHDTLGIFGTCELNDFWYGASIYVSQHGEDLNVYNEDATALGYTDDQMLADYYAMRARLMEADGVYPLPDELASVKDLQGDFIVTGQAAFAWYNSNQLVALTSAAGRELCIAPCPKLTADGLSGMSLRSSQAFSVSKSSENKEEAAKFINFFVNDIDANAILNGERGVPISSAVRESLSANMDDVNQKVFAYIDEVGQIASQKQPLEPAGQIEIEDATDRIAEELAFGLLTPGEAAAKFREEATDILSK